MFSESPKLQRFIVWPMIFCKEFVLQQEKYMIEDKKIRHRNKPNRMSDAEIMVILILFHLPWWFPLLFTRNMSVNI